MSWFISDELLIKIQNNADIERLRSLLSIRNEVKVTPVDGSFVAVKFTNKFHLMTTLKEQTVVNQIGDFWIRGSPHCASFGAHTAKRRAHGLSRPAPPEDTGPVEKLPADCLAHIFSFLPVLDRLNVEKVCTKWKKVGLEGWPDRKTLTVATFDHTKILPHFELILERCGRFLKTLELPGAHDNDEWDYLSLVQNCHQLENLSVNFRFENRRQKSSGLVEVLSQCSKLSSIIIKDGRLNLLKECMSHIASGNITKIELECNRLQRDEILHIDFSRFPHLQHLKLNNFANRVQLTAFNQLKDITFLNFYSTHISAEVMSVIPQFNKLTHLSLMSHPGGLNNDDYFVNIAMNCQELQYLEMWNFHEITDRTVVQLGQMPKLEVLKLYFSELITATGIASLHNIEQLWCIGCTRLKYTDGLARLIRDSSKIKYINTDLTALYLPHLQAANDALLDRTNRNDVPLKVILDVGQNDIDAEMENLRNPSPLLSVEFN